MIRKVIIVMKNYVKSDDKKGENGDKNCGNTKVLDDQNHPTGFSPTWRRFLRSLDAAPS